MIAKDKILKLQRAYDLVCKDKSKSHHNIVKSYVEMYDQLNEEYKWNFMLMFDIGSSTSDFPSFYGLPNFDISNKVLIGHKFFDDKTITIISKYKSISVNDIQKILKRVKFNVGYEILMNVLKFDDISSHRSYKYLKVYDNVYDDFNNYVIAKYNGFNDPPLIFPVKFHLYDNNRNFYISDKIIETITNNNHDINIDIIPCIISRVDFNMIDTYITRYFKNNLVAILDKKILYTHHHYIYGNKYCTNNVKILMDKCNEYHVDINYLDCCQILASYTPSLIDSFVDFISNDECMPLLEYICLFDDVDLFEKLYQKCTKITEICIKNCMINRSTNIFRKILNLKYFPTFDSLNFLFYKSINIDSKRIDQIISSLFDHNYVIDEDFLHLIIHKCHMIDLTNHEPDNDTIMDILFISSMYNKTNYFDQMIKFDKNYDILLKFLFSGENFNENILLNEIIKHKYIDNVKFSTSILNFAFHNNFTDIVKYFLDKSSKLAPYLYMTNDKKYDYYKMNKFNCYP